MGCLRWALPAAQKPPQRDAGHQAAGNKNKLAGRPCPADVRVAILSIRAAGTGLTLTAASTVRGSRDCISAPTWTAAEVFLADLELDLTF